MAPSLRVTTTFNCVVVSVTSSSLVCMANFVAGQLVLMTTGSGRLGGEEEVGEYSTCMIESEHTCSRSTPDFMVKLTPSVCGWIATTGFIGVHCASAGDTSSNTKSAVKQKRQRNALLSRITWRDPSD